ncbi:uncharacterized protein PSANT_02011 [Moesziomyces antarcticus]|uniref:Uncharacterized protein n=1 Tax=Pseudozyma antarctica TaxID=84753 RepID=A0A5C3FJJ8_PSEA2|nr:uncharacterized protein PSANT_02011 [Moesziomyces antarcticus]
MRTADDLDLSQLCRHAGADDVLVSDAAEVVPENQASGPAKALQSVSEVDDGGVTFAPGLPRHRWPRRGDRPRSSSAYDLTVPLDILEIAASGEKTTPFNMIIRINVIRKNRRCGNTNTRTIYVDIRTRSNTEMIVAKEKKLYLEIEDARNSNP